MTTIRTGASGEAVRDDPPAPNDFGSVVRPIGPIGPIIQGTSQLLNGTETAVGAVAVRVLAANVVPAGTPGARTVAIVQNKGTANICIGAAGVTAATGLRLVPNAIAIIDDPEIYPGEIWAIREVADSVAFAQEYVLV